MQLIGGLHGIVVEWRKEHAAERDAGCREELAQLVFEGEVEVVFE